MCVTIADPPATRPHDAWPIVCPRCNKAVCDCPPASTVPSPMAGTCSQGGDHDSQLSPNCQPPDYHCSKCGMYLGPA